MNKCIGCDHHKYGQKFCFEEQECKVKDYPYKIEGCEFCKDKKEKMPESGEFNFAFSIEDNELWAYDGYMDGGAAMKINYCPICGKKLAEV